MKRIGICLFLALTLICGIAFGEIAHPMGPGQLGFDAVVISKNISIRPTQNANAKAVKKLNFGGLRRVSREAGERRCPGGLSPHRSGLYHSGGTDARLCMAGAERQTGGAARPGRDVPDHPDGGRLDPDQPARFGGLGRPSQRGSVRHGTDEDSGRTPAGGKLPAFHGPLGERRERHV